MFGYRPILHAMYLGLHGNAFGEKGQGVHKAKRPDAGRSSQLWLVWFFSKFTLRHSLERTTCWLFQQVSTNVNGVTACERILSDRKVTEKSVFPGLKKTSQWICDNILELGEPDSFTHEGWLTNLPGCVHACSRHLHVN